MSTPKTRKIKYTGKEKISSLIDNGASVEWKSGDVKDVVESKVHNHIKYPYFEEVVESAKPEKKVKVKAEDIKEVEEADEVPEDAEVADEVEVIEKPKKKKGRK